MLVSERVNVSCPGCRGNDRACFVNVLEWFLWLSLEPNENLLVNIASTGGSVPFFTVERVLCMTSEIGLCGSSGYCISLE